LYFIVIVSAHCAQKKEKIMMTPNGVEKSLAFTLYFHLSQTVNKHNNLSLNLQRTLINNFISRRWLETTTTQQ